MAEDKGAASGGELDPKLLDILVCPLTKGPLRYDRARGELVSEQAGLAYPIRDGIPIMLAEGARPLPEAARTPPEGGAGGWGRRPLAARDPRQARREAARDRLRRRHHLRLPGRAAARREPLGRGPGPRAEPEGDGRRQAQRRHHAARAGRELRRPDRVRRRPLDRHLLLALPPPPRPRPGADLGRLRPGAGNEGAVARRLTVGSRDLRIDRTKR